MAETKFYSRLNRPKTIPNEPGDREEVQYIYQYNEKGQMELVVKDIIDVYQRAQDALPGVEIKTLIARYTMGDETALERVQGFYGDVTDVPTSYIEAFNLFQRAKSDFFELAPNIREEFNNSVEEFVAAIGTKDFNDRIAKYSKKETEPEGDIKE